MASSPAMMWGNTNNKPGQARDPIINSFKIMGKFELFRSNANQDFYFRFKDGNDNQLLSSEGYSSKAGCSNGIESVKKNAPNDQRYDRKDSEGHYTFNLKAANGEIIARSTKVYKTRSDREQAIETVKREAPNAPVVDLT